MMRLLLKSLAFALPLFISQAAQANVYLICKGTSSPTAWHYLEFDDAQNLINATVQSTNVLLLNSEPQNRFVTPTFELHKANEKTWYIHTSYLFNRGEIKERYSITLDPSTLTYRGYRTFYELNYLTNQLMVVYQTRFKEFDEGQCISSNQKGGQF